MKAEATPRIHLIFLLLLLFAGILGVRLFFVQIIHGHAYAAQADNQYITPVQDVFERGSIFFQEKDGTLVSAATLNVGFRVAISPAHIEDEGKTFSALSEIISLDSTEFYTKAAKKDDPYEEVARRVSNTDAARIKELSLSGVSVHREKWRYYPGEEKGAHILGFVGFEGDILTGRYGLERYYNDILSRNRDNIYVNFFAELFSNIADSFLRTENNKEGDIILTIEPNVLAAVERAIEEVQKEWGSDEIGAIVMNPQNGGIYAMAARPTFNPNSFQEEKDANVFSNPLVERVYEMGSIMKPITMASGLDSGAVTPETTYNDKGYTIKSGKRIENFDGKGRGVVDMQEVLNQSLNTGVAFVVEQMGNELFRDYMYAFGVADETGIDLPGEVAGLTANLGSGRDIEYATASFGQGIALSPIATARALSVLANGGQLVEPHVIDAIDLEEGGTYDVGFEDPRRVIKTKTAEEITRMLVSVVDEALRGGSVALPHYSIAAKTGTAQIANPTQGGYYDDRYLHSFFGYFPAYDPEFIIFLYHVNPKGARYASETLTYPFMDLTKFLINYYEIPPDR